MTVHVNGEAREIPEGTTVDQLIQILALGPVRVAVEVNKELVIRKTWAAHALKPGDRIEIVTFVGGG